MECVFTIDAGKDTTKALGRFINESTDKRTSFPTKIYKVDSDIEVDGNSHMVELENEKYIVGEQGQESDRDNSKKSITEITNSIKEKNINLSLLQPYSVGGTTNNILDNLKKQIPHIKQPDIDLQWVNVEGFHVVGKVKSGVI